MLAIGAYAGDYASDAKRFTGADLRSLDAFKYGKFVTSMKASMAKGTASAFYLLGEGDKKVFD
jgi:beta-glucanase (GH16 family)